MSDKRFNPDLLPSFLAPLQSAEQMRDWILAFLDIDLPIGHVDEDSNSSPIEAMFDAYVAYRDDKCIEIPGFIWLASRDSGKTLCGSILNILLMLHFKAQISHLAAIKAQSEKCLQYCNTFVRYLRPYIEASDRKIIGESKSKVQILNEDDSISYINVIVASLAGGNCIDPQSMVHFWDGSIKRADEVKPGDILRTYDYKINNFVPVTVGSISYTQKEAREIVFDDGSNLICSDDHLLFTDHGWRCASALQSWHKMFSDGSAIKTASLPPMFSFSPDYLFSRKAELITLTLDEGAPANLCEGIRFYWSDYANKNNYEESLNISLKQLCTTRPVRINFIGKMELIDIHIDDPRPERKSFLVNSLKLVHNSEHTPVASYDEIDTLSPQGLIGYNEAKLIPTRYKGKGPLVIKYSTRKFAFGIFEEEISNAGNTGEKVLRWNMLDITEKCSPDRYQPKKKKVVRYIGKNLPLSNISEVEFNDLIEERKEKYDQIVAYAGCATCPLLPVCKTKLATRPPTPKDSFYRPVDYTIQLFRKISADLAEAQLLCRKPSSLGLVYPRFMMDTKGGNLLTIADAWEYFTGTSASKDLTLQNLIDTLHRYDIPFYAGLDWGFRHNYAIIVGALMPFGEFWIFETLAIPGLEFSDQLKYAKYIRDKYRILKWYADTSMPGFIKTFRRNRMSCANFKKAVMDGVEGIRKVVVDSSGKRRLKVLVTESNELVLNGFKKHHFKLDAAGRPTTDVADDEWADIMDSLRYIGQNLFQKDKKEKDPQQQEKDAILAQHHNRHNKNINKIHADFISSQIRNLTGGMSSPKGKNASSSIIWDFSGSDGDE